LYGEARGEAHNLSKKMKAEQQVKNLTFQLADMEEDKLDEVIVRIPLKLLKDLLMP
jgi:hypothetical protein